MSDKKKPGRGSEREADTTMRSDTENRQSTRALRRASRAIRRGVLVAVAIYRRSSASEPVRP